MCISIMTEPAGNSPIHCSALQIHAIFLDMAQDIQELKIKSLDVI